MTRRRQPRTGPLAIGAEGVAQPEDFAQLTALGYIERRADGSLVVTDAGTAALVPLITGNVSCG